MSDNISDRSDRQQDPADEVKAEEKQDERGPDDYCRDYIF